MNLANHNLLLELFSNLHPTGPTYEALVTALDKFTANEELYLASFETEDDQPKAHVQMTVAANELLETLNARHAALAEGESE